MQVEVFPRPLGRANGGSKRDHCVPKKDTAQPKATINGMKYATKVKKISIFHSCLLAGYNCEGL